MASGSPSGRSLLAPENKLNRKRAYVGNWFESNLGHTPLCSDLRFRESRSERD
jgi:hypothetical protein